jgi:hypothetical protein
MTTTATPKRAPRERTALDDLRDLNKRRADIAARQSEVGAELNGAKARIEALKEERALEQRTAAQQLRPPDLLSIDERTRTAKADLAGLEEQLRALKAVENGVLRDILDLHAERRTEFAERAREGSALDEREGKLAAKKLSEWLMCRRTNRSSWQLAWRGIPVADQHGERDPFRPEVFGGRTDARLPGMSLADRVELPSSARQTVDHKELWDVEVLAGIVAEWLERNAGTPAGLVPSDALQGRAGWYRSATIGTEQRLTHRMLHGDERGPRPSTQLLEAVRIDDCGMAQLVWQRDLGAEEE